VNLLIKLVILFLLSACAQEPAPVHKAKVLSFGTYVDVTLYGVTEERARKAILQVEAQLNVMHEQWHAWRPSNITALNDNLRSGKQFSIDVDMLPLVAQSKKLYSASNGYFNPAIGELIELWGFYKDDPQSNKSIPEASVIEDYVTNLPTMDDVHIENDFVYGSNSRLKLDFGGYAKGYGVEQLIRYLRKNGIENALINAGGDIKGIGSVGKRAWKVAIKNPKTEAPLAWLELKDNESIFSSGSYLRYFEYEGKRFHHIINPKTGFPSEGSSATTVITEDAAVADAAATALMIAPQEEWLDIANQMGITHFLIIDAQGTLYCDDLFAKRLQLITTEQQLTIVGALTQI